MIASCMNGNSRTSHPKNQINERGDARVVPSTGLMAPLKVSGKQTHAQGTMDEDNTFKAAAPPPKPYATTKYDTTSSDETMRDRDVS